MSDLKTQRKKWSEEDDRRIMALHRQGFSGAVIGQRFGVTRDAVLGRIRKLKLKGTQNV